ncbi:MAG: hypothetical protein KC994_23270 [Candidatus Omnitrophica bacterium]|nr:hypothetical protein [Candidatus Omnitrophota bacterium]
MANNFKQVLLVYFPPVAALCFCLIIVYFCYAAWECTNTGPYVTRYNQRLMALATENNLRGKTESEVEKVLGEPTFVWRRWNKWRMDTGEPTSDAEFIVTYNYAPFRFFPSKVFQVHMKDDKVSGLEMFDD